MTRPLFCFSLLVIPTLCRTAAHPCLQIQSLGTITTTMCCCMSSTATCQNAMRSNDWVIVMCLPCYLLSESNVDPVLPPYFVPESVDLTAVVTSASPRTDNVRGTAQTVTSDVVGSVEAASRLLRLHPPFSSDFCRQFCVARIAGSSLCELSSRHVSRLSCLVIIIMVRFPQPFWLKSCFWYKRYTRSSETSGGELEVCYSRPRAHAVERSLFRLFLARRPSMSGSSMVWNCAHCQAENWMSHKWCGKCSTAW